MPKLHFGIKNSILTKTTEVPFIGFTALGFILTIPTDTGLRVNSNCTALYTKENQTHIRKLIVVFPWNRFDKPSDPAPLTHNLACHWKYS